jgi:hypothetical protein
MGERSQSRGRLSSIRRNTISKKPTRNLKKMGIGPDGYSWGEFIRMSISKVNPGLAERLNLTDCETATCVIWVESDEDCRMLLETTWTLLFNG